MTISASSTESLGVRRSTQLPCSMRFECWTWQPPEIAPAEELLVRIVSMLTKMATDGLRPSPRECDRQRPPSARPSTNCPKPSARDVARPEESDGDMTRCPQNRRAPSRATPRCLGRFNIAEGTGRRDDDQRQFYRIARGSALDSAAVLDAIRVLDLATSGDCSG